MTTDPTPNHGRGCTLGQPYGECGAECGIQPFQWKLLDSAQIYVDEFGRYIKETTIREQLSRERTWTATHEDLYQWIKEQPSSFKQPHESFIDMIKRMREEAAAYDRLIDEALDV